jgi:hypothetical protein
VTLLTQFIVVHFAGVLDE